MGTAPVCPISRDQALPGMRPHTLPVPPRAMDLPSLIAATNALRDLVLAFMGPGLAPNNLLGADMSPLNRGTPTQDAGKPMVVVKNDWLEVRRFEEPKRIHHKKKGGGLDKNIFIDVLRINKLVFHWEHNDMFMPEDAFEWAYQMYDYTPDYWSMDFLWSIPGGGQPTTPEPTDPT